MNSDEISCAELAEVLGGDAAPMLLDCREAGEWELVRLPDAHWIPLRETPERLEEIRELVGAREVVVYCHHGVRSLYVTHFLREQGISRVRSLRGGIDAWAREISPEMPRY